MLTQYVGTIIRSQAWFASWDGTMTTQEDWRLRNVIRSVTFISGDSSFPCYIEVSLHCNNLRRKVIKEGSTKPQTSVREINSNKGAIGDIYVVWSVHTTRVLAFIAFHSLFNLSYRFPLTNDSIAFWNWGHIISKFIKKYIKTELQSWASKNR